jgi:hypothetical protein
MSRVGRNPDSGIGQQLVLQFSNERFNQEIFSSQRTRSRGDGRASSHSLHRPDHVNQVNSDQLGILYHLRNQRKNVDSSGASRASRSLCSIRCNNGPPQSRR